MKVFLDTNIIIDVLLLRQPYSTASRTVLERCGELKCEVFIAWHGLATAFYILGNSVGEAKAQMAMKDFMRFVKVANVGDREAHLAFALGFEDFEDALQAVSAQACAADCIVTRNAADFAGSPVRVLMPEHFLSQFPGDEK